MEPPLCVVSNWIIKVYTILVWNTISGSSNLDMCCYHCWIFTLIFHLKVLINFFFIIIIIIIITIIIVVIVLLLTIIYTINLLVVRPRSCRVIYYFDTPALGRRHQSFWSCQIHLVYVRILDKGITLHRLLRGDDDDTSEIGIGNVLNKNNHVWSYKVWNGG